MKSWMLAGVAAAALSGPALATPPMTPWTGYLDFAAGGATGNASDVGSSWSQKEISVHGAARFAIPVSPATTVQLDGWADAWSDTYSSGSPDRGLDDGLGIHVNWRAAPMTSIGVLGSVGQDGNSGSVVTVAGEVVRWMGKFRLYGQAGYSFGLSGEDRTSSAPYVAGVLSYYCNPDLALSAMVAFDHATTTAEADNENDASWGARIEFKKPDMPFSIYTAYRGWSWNGSDGGGGYNGLVHDFIVGLRMPLGGSASGSLKDLDMKVGLTDMNPYYGE